VENNMEVPQKVKNMAYFLSFPHIS